MSEIKTGKEIYERLDELYCKQHQIKSAHDVNSHARFYEGSLAEETALAGIAVFAKRIEEAETTIYLIDEPVCGCAANAEPIAQVDGDQNTTPSGDPLFDVVVLALKYSRYNVPHNIVDSLAHEIVKAIADSDRVVVDIVPEQKEMDETMAAVPCSSNGQDGRDAASNIYLLCEILRLPDQRLYHDVVRLANEKLQAVMESLMPSPVVGCELQEVHSDLRDRVNAAIFKTCDKVINLKDVTDAVMAAITNAKE